MATLLTAISMHLPKLRAGLVIELALIIMSLVLSGCSAVGPDYVRHDPLLSAVWHSELKSGLIAGVQDPEALAKWWTSLNDPELSSLIERTVSGNLDLKNAYARLREARARRRVAKADLYPAVDASGTANLSRSSEDTGTGKSSENYSAGFDASWELDIFGGVRRSVEASQADLEAAQEDLRDVLVSLIAEVALNYVEVRTFQNRLAIAESNLRAQDETYQLTSWRYQAGLSDELSMHQARYSLESTRSSIPSLRAGLEGAMNRIAVLLGEQPGKVHEELKPSAPIPVAESGVAVGVPADILRQRPDVRRAERELAAQTAKIGVATADLYPKLSLSGSIGLEALSPKGLFSSPTLTSTGGGLITLPIFRAGAIRQNIEIQSALQEQALIVYEAAIIGALEEVENALVAYTEELFRRDALSVAEEEARKALELAKYKYEGGLTDFSDVLEAQRSLASFQDQLAESKGAVASNLIRLYKAMGGGWTPMAFDKAKTENTNETEN